MGQEIKSSEFSDQDFIEFKKKLRNETKELKRWFKEGVFDDTKRYCGLELEAWITTPDFVPSPTTESFLKHLNDPLVVPEISKFNFELNSIPYPLASGSLLDLEEKTLGLWRKCEKQAQALDQSISIIGTLPTLRDYMLTGECLSPQKRYFALNQQVMKMRDHQPVNLCIERKDSINVTHQSVITECAATSMQIHFGVFQETAAKYYNASIVASAFIAATAANSPFLYGQEVWDESRIPIFEQSVNLKCFRTKDGELATRVGLGNGYIRNSLLELFLENLDGYPIMLPEVYDTDPQWLEHLRLHNGTIWRWNRPLIGLSKQGNPTLRLEFRVPSAGPTIRDSIANMAFQIALTHYLFSIEDLEQKLPFESAKRNFYDSAKFGLDAQIMWIDKKKHNIQEFILNTLMPHLPKALINLGFGQYEANLYLIDTIKPRVLGGQNGASWQKGFVHTHGCRFQELMEQYNKNQQTNTPVHQWSL